MVATRKHEIRPLTSDVTGGNVSGILAKLYRIILSDLCIDDERFHAILARYVKQGEVKGIKDGRKSLDRELLKVAMTWKTYLRGIAALRMKSSTFTVKLYRSLDDEDCVITMVNIKPERKIRPGEYLSELLIAGFIELGMHGDKYNEFMDEYIQSSRSLIHRREKSTIRASLSKELFSPEITFRSYIKGLTLAKVARVEIEHRLKHGSGRVTRHRLSVVLSTLRNEDEDE